MSILGYNTHMQSVFKIKKYKYPYEGLKFPGQHSEEKILFITREGKIILKLKLLTTVAIFIIGFILGIITLSNAAFLNFYFKSLISVFIFGWFFGGILIFWWIYKVWQKSIFVITTRRLTKFIHTTPWSRYQLSLGLDKIVDTGAYQKGFFQMLTGLGYFVARSSAGNIKNFKLINIGFAEDLHNYVNKLLFVFNEKAKELNKFRPFIPHLKGEKRDEFVRKVTPKYAKPKTLQN
jgi:hypothetical protein